MERSDESSGSTKSIVVDPPTPSLIRSARAALMLASLRARRPEIEDNDRKERELRAKRLLADLVVETRSDMCRLKRLDHVDIVLRMLVVVIFVLVVVSC